MSFGNKKDDNTIKIKMPGFNIGAALFIIILLYISFISIHYLSKEHISICEVTEKQIYDDNEMVGIAIRSEDVYTSDAAGYVGYFNGNKAKVAKGAVIYTINKENTHSGKNSSIQPVKLTNDNISSVRKTIDDFRNGFSYSNYEAVYDFKYNIESSLYSYDAEELSGSMSDASLKVCNSSNSGIITYWADGLEGLKEEDITEDSFDESIHEKKLLKTSDKVSPGDKICKVVTDESWDIIVKVDEKQKSKLEEMKSVPIKFTKDDFKTTAECKLITIKNVDYAKLTLNKYMEKYLDDRYINLELILSSAEGLKIPTSAIIEKNCYIIPKSYLTMGGDSNKESISYYAKNDKGEEELLHLDSFAYKDDENVYVDAMLLNPGTQITNPADDSRMTLERLESVKGVYNVNEGYCKFKHIKINYENQEYCIVEKGNPYGLAVYDHIVINPEQLNENDIIY